MANEKQRSTKDRERTGKVVKSGDGVQLIAALKLNCHRVIYTSVHCGCD